MICRVNQILDESVNLKTPVLINSPGMLIGVFCGDRGVEVNKCVIACPSPSELATTTLAGGLKRGHPRPQGARNRATYGYPA